MPQLRRAARSERSLLPAPQWLYALNDPILRLLAEARIEIVGRLVDASNATFLVELDDSGGRRRAVYKPTRGERPLDDFPSGTLAAREVAAHTLSEAAGFGVVPPTVLRDGPLGQGMVQAWVDVDPAVDVVRLVVESDPRLRRLALFDAIANNADRKAGHLLPLPDGRIWGVDHGICFAAAPKLRTVLWAWRGQPLDEAELALVDAVAAGLDGPLRDRLGELLSPAEVAATRRRVAVLRRRAHFPLPDPHRPALPWPPY